MTAEQRAQAEELFAALCEADAAEREAVLTGVSDDAVRGEVASLLRHTGGAAPGLNGAIGQVMREAAASGALDSRTAGPGSRFGHYRIERHLGQGGMGDVYEATRDDDFRKRVALKIVRNGFDSEYARTQFQRERQVLAGLEHPYIARLLDGGDTGGCPYLVLEYVDGTPIDVYCADKPREAVLELFIKVCEAVSYAHRSLVVHRDLKPANILVTAEGDPKLLDFGIARLLDPGADLTMTRFAALTPQYASPEQLRGKAIGTSTDVYSLGVVLYELLTGRRPYVLAAATAVEVDRLVCEADPPPPGASEDLDNIVMMALRKDPARRYGSVQDLAEDLLRSLTHRPVAARPDTVRYRARKFVRRNWPALVAGVALFTAVSGGVAATLYQAKVAGERFQQVRKLAHNFIFDYDAELSKLDGSTAVREKMVNTALEYLEVLSASAGRDLALQAELAEAWQRVGDVQGYPTRQSLGHTQQAIASYGKAAELHERIAARDGTHRRRSAKFYMDFAHLLRLTGDFEGAKKMAAEAQGTLQQVLEASSHDDTVRLTLAAAVCLSADVDADRAHSHAAFEEFHRCDEMNRDVVKRTRSREAMIAALASRSGLAAAQAGLGRLEEALRGYGEYEKLLREMIAREPENPTFHRSLAVIGQWKSAAYYDDVDPNLNDPARCLKYAREYLDGIQKMVARDPNNTTAAFSLAVANYRLSLPLRMFDPAAAVGVAREAVRLFDAQIAKGQGSYLVVSRRARAMRRLAEALVINHQPAAAFAPAAEALAAERKEAARDVKDVREKQLLTLALISSAKVADALHRTAEAAALLSEASGIAEALLAGDREELSSITILTAARVALSEHCRSTGDLAGARLALGDAMKLWQSYPEQNDFVRRSSGALAEKLRRV